MPNYYRISDPSDVRDLELQRAAWAVYANPKQHEWAEQPAAPSADAVWQDGAWSVPPAPTFTPADWVDQQGYAGNRSTTMLYLKLQLDAAGKSSAKLASVQGWLDALIVAGVTQPEERRSDWPAAPYSFEEASGEALAILAAP
jgi:hypothetical protein